jgi:hypothetical protein
MAVLGMMIDGLSNILGIGEDSRSKARFAGLTPVTVDAHEIQNLLTYYYKDDVCVRCRNVLMGLIMCDLKIEGTWNDLPMTEDYSELLRKPLILFLDLMITIGAVPYRPVVVHDRAGRPQTIPMPFQPEPGGQLVALWRGDVFTGMVYQSDTGRIAEVACSQLHPPDRTTGTPRSMLAGVEMRLDTCWRMENTEATAAATAARPPLVLVHAGEAMYAMSASDQYRLNGGGIVERDQADQAALNAQQQQRAKAAVAMGAAAAGGNAPSAPGSRLFVPNTFTGEWPRGPALGAFYDNQHFVPAGYQVSRHEPPHVLSDSTKWRTMAEHVICNMFGVSITLLYPDSVSSRYKMSQLEAVTSTRGLAIWNITAAAHLLQSTLNAMFQGTDSLRMAMEVVINKRARPSTAAARDRLARAVLKRNRYALRVSFGNRATAEEIGMLYGLGFMSLETAKQQFATKFGMSIDQLDGGGAAATTEKSHSRSGSHTGPGQPLSQDSGQPAT